MQVTIVGAGPAGLACAAALRCHDAAAIRVIDPTGGWLRRWRERFDRQDIAVLRSPAVHHPHPDPFALLGRTCRTQLVRQAGTHLPTRAGFESFIDTLVDEFDLAEVVEARRAVNLEVDAAGRPSLALDDGEVDQPQHLVLATDPRRPVIPEPLHGLLDDPRLAIGHDADVRSAQDRERIVVLGGGLSAAHLALGAAARGAAVTLIARRRLEVRRYDVHPSWLGPHKLRPFEQEPDPHRRMRALTHARGGGTVPHGVRARLGEDIASGRIVLRERCTVTKAAAHRDRLELTLCDGVRVAADRVWTATGSQVDVGADRLLAPLLASGRTVVAGGLPDIQEDLRLPGTWVHLAGSAAGLRLGPTAGNLVGHRRAALRIRAAVTGLDPRRADRIATGRAACPSRPES